MSNMQFYGCTVHVFRRAGVRSRTSLKAHHYAQEVGTTPQTVAAAYRLLSDDGLVATRTRGGTVLLFAPGAASQYVGFAGDLPIGPDTVASRDLTPSASTGSGREGSDLCKLFPAAGLLSAQPRRASSIAFAPARRQSDGGGGT
jgi:DNA-binding transcriptional MocR family regulator